MFQMVRLVNRGSENFVDSYNSQRFVVKAGDEGGTFVPFEAAVVWFGHPGLVNSARSDDRDKEFARIQTRYGAFADLDADMQPGAWNRNRPRIEVFNTETGERIYMCMDDPEGDHVAVDTNKDLSEQDLVTAKLASYENAMEQMQQAINRLLAQQQQGTIDGLPSDSPDITSESTPDSVLVPTLGPITSVTLADIPPDDPT